MATVPDTRIGRVQFYESHLAAWTANAVAIGLTAPQISSLEDLVDAARKDFTDAESARDDSKSATQTFYTSADAMQSFGAELIKTIRLKAESTNNPAVYTLANIPPPASPTPAAPPAQPTDLSVRLDASSGALTLTWKCANPPGTSGTAYIIRRKAAGQSDFTFVGTSTGKKSFVDTTLAAGPDSVQYTVQGQRSDVSGPLSPVCTVYFGIAPGGQLTARVIDEGGESPAASGMSGSTVNGRSVQKTLPAGNGHSSRV